MYFSVKNYRVKGKHLKFTRIGIGIKSANTNFAATLGRKFGWGGRIRTFTVLINSEVSYQLDHAPAGFADPSVAGVAQTEIR